MLLRLEVALVFFQLSNLARSLHLDHRDLEASFLDCYDYVVVGGGISGMVVANRLTEDQDVTVLVLESGDLDHHEDFIMYPIEDGNGLGTSYDWNLWTTPQEHLDGLSRPYDMGRGVGGGSLINGMCWTRGGKADFDAWVTLGNPGWGWDDLLPYFIKTENYTAHVDADVSHTLYVQPDLLTHGSSGNIQVSYPRYFHNQSRLFLEGLKELGIPILTDPNNGSAAGGMLIPNSLDPVSQTRSSARTGYFDGFAERRPNLHVATGQLVTRVLLDTSPHNLSRPTPTGLRIVGVEFITNVRLDIIVITCSSEVILAAGSVHTPQILELSGMGSSSILKKFDIPVNINLPGVGNNLQDHPYVGVIYYVSNSSYITTGTIESNPELLNRTWQEYYFNRSGPWTAGAINTVAFPSLPSVSQNWTNMMTDALNQDTGRFLLPDIDATVVAGYTTQKSILIGLLSNHEVGAYEILSDNVGLLAISAMHPFSRGSVHIQSTSPLVQPAIDPRYCSNPLDCQVLVEGFLFNNKLLRTKAMRLLDQIPYGPFYQDATSETLMPAIRSGIRTEFHGVGTTAMLPLELGGVVDTHLRVYGTRNLRIVDAGIMPLVPAAHLQASVYAVAEKAADIIKNDNTGFISQDCGGGLRPRPLGKNLSSTEATPLPKLSTSTTLQTPKSSISSQVHALTTGPIPENISTPIFIASFGTGVNHPAPSQLPSSNMHVIAAAADVLLRPSGPLSWNTSSLNETTNTVTTSSILFG